MTDSQSSLRRFAGLDLAKESIHACVVDQTGFKIDKQFKTKTEDIIDLNDWLKSLDVKDIVLENTGIYSEPVTAILKTKFVLNVVNAADTKRSNKKKTDSDDAWWLAELLKSGTIGKGRKIEISYLPSQNQSQLKKMTRLRSKNTTEATKQKNRIVKIFSRYNIKIFEYFGQNKFTQTAFTIYWTIAEGKDLNTLLKECKLKGRTLKGSEKKQNTRIITFLEKNMNELQFTLKNGIREKFLREDQIEMTISLEYLQIAQKTIQIINNEISRIINENKQFGEQLEILYSIPGIGETTGTQILAELPPMDHFTNEKQFASYTGLCPRVTQSAEVCHLGPINKRGPKYLREGLFQAAKIASMRSNTAIGRKFKHLFKRKGKGKGKLVWIAIARHIANLIYILLTRKQKYKDHGYKTKSWSLARKKLERMTIQDIAEELKMKNYHVSIYSMEDGVCLS